MRRIFTGLWTLGAILWILGAILFILCVIFRGPWWLLCTTGLIVYAPLIMRLGRRE